MACTAFQQGNNTHAWLLSVSQLTWEAFSRLEVRSRAGVLKRRCCSSFAAVPQSFEPGSRQP